MDKSKIQNLREKRLLVTRRMLVDKTESTDENIIATWRIVSMLDADKVALDKDLIEWIRRHVNSNNVKSCDSQLASVRRKGERNLKSKAKIVGYGAKLVKSPKNALATYNIFTKGKKYSGNFYRLIRRLGTLTKVSTEKKEINNYE